MKKFRLLQAWFVLLLAFPGESIAQSFWDDTSITAGIALASQDRRLFHFAGAEGVLSREDSNLDYEYNLSFQKGLIKTGRLRMNLGLGYSEFHTTFSRPFRHSELNGGLTRELRFIKRYTINKLFFILSGQWSFRKDHWLFFKFEVLPQVAFRKSATDLSFEKRVTKREWEFHGLELYPGIGAAVSPRLHIGAHYRLFYTQKLDGVIFNHLLFPQTDPEFLRKEYDDFNPFKLWFTVSYFLK